MLKNPQTGEQMIEDEGAEFKVGRVYYKYIDGILHCGTKECEEWITAKYKSKFNYKGMIGFVDFKTKAEKDDSRMKNELYASLELQITMAQDYAEWLKQETKRNDELLNSHSTALRRLNDLMVQSPSEEENVDSGRGEELPEGLKWEDAPYWADMLAEGENDYIWCNGLKYKYFCSTGVRIFGNGYKSKYDNVSQLKIIATRPEEV